MENLGIYIKNGLYLSFTIFGSIVFTEIVSESVLKTVIFTSSFLSFLIFRYQKENDIQRRLMDFFFENQRLRFEKEEFEKEIKELEKKVKEKILIDQIEYQSKIGKCIVPYCERDILSVDSRREYIPSVETLRGDKICTFHSRFKEDCCPVCYEIFSKRDIPLKCGHWIHRNCVFQSKKEICPICKHENILDF